MDLVKVIAELDRLLPLHAARLLILIAAFSDASEGRVLKGLTKLAKLDFLLRYPVMLERALTAKGRSTREVQLADHERLSVESQMVRYRFGPWDHRYRQFLNILAAKGLITMRVEGRAILIQLTEKGRGVAAAFRSKPEFQDYSRRAMILTRHFDIGATKLMRFIYDTFPELISLRPNERIPT